MTKKTMNLLGIVLVILAGTYFYVNYCSECATTTEEKGTPLKTPPAPTAPRATSYPFAFSSGDYAYSVNDNYNFNVSSSSILMPISQKVTEGISDLKTFLGENADKVINITGFYKSDETNDTAFPNLGLARANVVKNHLAANGISSTRINTIGRLMDNMVAKDGVYLGPLSYTLQNRAVDAEAELQALHDKIIANPLVLYFETGQATINLTADQRQKVADISRYLDKMKGAKAKVVGHTDSSGNRAKNIELGQGRADFAMGYLIRNGIPKTKIEASSDGPDSPVATNDTEEGKSKNRRTVVTINK